MLVMTGATLPTVTVWVAGVLLGVSGAVPWAGPGRGTGTSAGGRAPPPAERQTSRPPLAVVVVVPTWLPPVPQLTLTTLNVSTPGSVTEKAQGFVLPSPAGAGGRGKATVGATLATVTVWVAVLLLALSESFTCTDTVELAGPSGKEQ